MPSSGGRMPRADIRRPGLTAPRPRVLASPARAGRNRRTAVVPLGDEPGEVADRQVGADGLDPDPLISTWIRSQSAQIRATIPARCGPIQNCRWHTIMFPLGGTTRSNSTGLPSRAALVADAAGLAASGFAWPAGSRALAFSRVTGSHRPIRSRCRAGTAANRSAGVTGYRLRPEPARGR